MIYEKIFSLSIARDAKIVVKADIRKRKREINVDLDFLIRDTHEGIFHLPIGINHPRYWKLKKVPDQKSRQMQMEYSGISRKQLLLVMEEFKGLVGDDFTIRYDSVIEEGLKHLKGVKIAAADKRAPL
jgi:hypothetical protein